MSELLEGINDSTFMKKSKGRGSKLIEEPEITCTVKGQQKSKVSEEKQMSGNKML